MLQAPLLMPPQNTELANLLHTDLNFGIRYTPLRRVQNKDTIYCLSVAPIHDEYFDLDCERAKAVEVWHVVAILSVIAFNLLQNTFSWLNLFVMLNVNSKLIYIPIVVCALATFIQNLVARALKIVKIPLHLTEGQKILLSTIEHQLENMKNARDNDITLKQLKKELEAEGVDKESEDYKRKKKEYKKSKALDDLLVLVSPQEFEAISKPFFNCYSKKDRQDFDYMLQEIVKRYQTQVHILIVKPEDYANVDPNKLPIKTNYTILNYSVEHYDSTGRLGSLIEIVNAPLNWRRSFINNEYWQHIKKSGNAWQLRGNMSSDLLEIAILIVGQIIVTTLQGVSSLSDTLAHFRINATHLLYARLLVTFIGLFIGGNKAYVNNEIKGDVALERLHGLYKKLNCFSSSHKNESTPKSFERNLLADLCALFSCDSSISFYKRKLIAYYYLVPFFHEFISWFSAAGTAFYYGGLAFLFGGPGLVFNLITLDQLGAHIPIPAENSYSYAWFDVFCAYNCISQMGLSGILNQGYDSVENAHKRANKIREKTHKLIEENDPSKHHAANCIPVFISDIFLKNSFDKNFRIAYTLLDSLSACVVAITGSAKMASVISFWIPCLHPVMEPLPYIIGATFFYTQTQYSFVLYGRDGRVWEIIGNLHMPTCIKHACGIKDNTPYPYSNNAYPNPFAHFSRIEPALPSADSKFSLKTASTNSMIESPMPPLISTNL